MGTRARRFASSAVWTAAIGLTLPAAAGNQPVIVGELTVIEHRPPDDIFGFPGLNLTLRVDVTHADGLAALTGPPAGATAEANNNDFPFLNPTPLTSLVPTGPSSGYFIALLPITAGDFPDISGRYQYLVTDTGSQTDQLQSHNLNRLEVIPLPTGLMVSNDTTQPVFSFTDPDPTPNVGNVVRYYQVWIIDAALSGVALIDAPDDEPAIPIPPGLLCPCADYYLRAQSGDFDLTDEAAENLAEAYLPFRPTDVAPNGDMTRDCRVNGLDIQVFVEALADGSAAADHLCPGDFNDSLVIDLGDLPGFVTSLLAP